MELTRRNFASMGPEGKDRLARRIRFAETLVQDLAHLKALATEIVERERLKLDAANFEQEFVDVCYFPLVKLLSATIEKAIS
jgi:NuA3 HAT complex component NTO1